VQRAHTGQTPSIIYPSKSFPPMSKGAYRKRCAPFLQSNTACPLGELARDTVNKADAKNFVTLSATGLPKWMQTMRRIYGWRRYSQGRRLCAPKRYDDSLI
jgi:hypothetical protein